MSTDNYSSSACIVLGDQLFDHLTGFILNCMPSRAQEYGAGVGIGPKPNIKDKKLAVVYSCACDHRGLDIIFYAIQKGMRVLLNKLHYNKKFHILCDESAQIQTYEIIFDFEPFFIYMNKTNNKAGDTRTIEPYEQLYRFVSSRELTAAHIRGRFEASVHFQTSGRAAMLFHNISEEYQLKLHDKFAAFTDGDIKQLSEGRRGTYTKSYTFNSAETAKIMRILYKDYSHEYARRYEVPNLAMFEKYLHLNSLTYDEIMIVHKVGDGDIKYVRDSEYIISGSRIIFTDPGMMIISTDIKLTMPEGYFWMFTPAATFTSGYIVLNAVEDDITKQILLVVKKTRQQRLTMPIIGGTIRPMKNQYLPMTRAPEIESRYYLPALELD